MKKLLASFAIVFASAWAAGSANAAPCGIVITSPCTITASGAYVLGANLNMTSVPYDPLNGLQLGIRVAANNVTINCDIFSIRHEGGYASTAVGIYGKLVSNVKIRNCNIYGQGMMQGIVIDNAEDPDNFTGAEATNNVVSARLIGIQLRTKNHIVADNHVWRLGRQQVYTDGFPGGIFSHGMGGSVQILRNRITHLENTDEVFGISCAQCFPGTINGNIVENYTKLADSWGMWINAGEYTIEGNSIKNFQYGFGLVVGSSGAITDTVFSNVDTDYIPSSMPDLSTWDID